MINDTPEPSPRAEKYFPLAQIRKISGGDLPIELGQLFKEGDCFRRENVLFKVTSINNKKATVTLSVEGVFGAIEGIKETP